MPRPARITENTITDPERLKEQLSEVRKLGYAIDDMEGEESVRCVGAPIFDLTGNPIAAISVAGPAFRTDFDRLRSFAPLVIEAARAISRELGFESGSDAGKERRCQGVGDLRRLEGNPGDAN